MKQKQKKKTKINNDNESKETNAAQVIQNLDMKSNKGMENMKWKKVEEPEDKI